MKRIAKFIATLGPIGYLSAPGTMGTIATLPLVYWLSTVSFAHQCAAILLLIVVSFFIIQQALTSFKVADPSHIILDEVVGCFITFIGIPICGPTLFAGFILFRLFDILKPFGIKRLERLSGARGVLIDDCVAGLLANIVLHYLMI